ncbi:ATP-binding protein [Curtobacterium flaccumfaciens]|uniref:ATP-binding protein n=1 Tax=Curtobacterium flaccumfaciens TaxID=2035 RepID=UPI001ADC4C4B|nr:ATP-binding protein [Curtobacterium flaccumfaciens]MBO9041365.1 ATP-binding protein [Curtobacterium flaccumfaciens pv. flaccumfaciens]
MNGFSDLAKVVAVGPNIIEIELTSTDEYQQLEQKLQIGSYLKISDDQDAALVAVVDGFRVRDSLSADGVPTDPKFVLSLQPVGRLEDGKFHRGGKQITIPPQNVELAENDLLERIYSGEQIASKFNFSTLVQDPDVKVSLDGDRFFGKHIGVVGSTGSGKSSTVAAIIQAATKPSSNQVARGVLNNSHVIIFDIHGEYSTAFPDARVITAENLKLPYWLMNSEELEELFIESNEQNSHNQISQFRHAVIANKQRHNRGMSASQVSYDSPAYFSLEEVLQYIDNLNSEVIGRNPGEGLPKSSDTGIGRAGLIDSREEFYFLQKVPFVESSQAGGKKATAGPFSGEFNRFLMRLESRRADRRLDFLLSPTDSNGRIFRTDDMDLLMSQFMGFEDNAQANVTILDLSGIPFEVLSVVVSLVSRLVFTFSFHFKKLHAADGIELPFLLVFEEAHNYIPQTSAARFNSVKKSIERVAKEGRKYGVSLMIVSQRPSEVSETVFSQCSNFVAMRLTNPADQNYVKRLLPDDLGALTNSLASLEQREAVIIGDAIVLPSLVRVDAITQLPRSMDVNFHTAWQEDWAHQAFEGVIDRWRR